MLSLVDQRFISINDISRAFIFPLGTSLILYKVVHHSIPWGDGHTCFLICMPCVTMSTFVVFIQQYSYASVIQILLTIIRFTLKAVHLQYICLINKLFCLCLFVFFCFQLKSLFEIFTFVNEKNIKYQYLILASLILVA